MRPFYTHRAGLRLPCSGCRERIRDAGLTWFSLGTWRWLLTWHAGGARP